MKVNSSPGKRSLAILKRRALILNTFVVVAAVVAGTFLMPKQYESRMKILVKNERADMIVPSERNDRVGHTSEARRDVSLKELVAGVTQDRRSGGNEDSPFLK